MMQLNNMSQPWTSPQHAQTVPCPSQLPSICLGIRVVLSSKELFHLLSSQFAAIVHHQLDLGDWSYSGYSQALTKILSECSLPEGHDWYRTVYNWIVLKQKCEHVKYRADQVVLLKKWETCVNPSWSCKNRMTTVTANLKRADKWRRHSWHSREYHPLALHSVHIPNAVRHHPSVSIPSLWQCEATVPRQEPKEGLYKYVWECQSMGTLNFDHT